MIFKVSSNPHHSMILSSHSCAPNGFFFLLTENAATLHLRMVCFHAALLCRPFHHHVGKGCCRFCSWISFPLNKDSRKTSSSSVHQQHLCNIWEYFTLNPFVGFSSFKKKKYKPPVLFKSSDDPNHDLTKNSRLQQSNLTQTHLLHKYNSMQSVN